LIPAKKGSNPSHEHNDSATDEITLVSHAADAAQT
jgi:hypothetical protein